MLVMTAFTTRFGNIVDKVCALAGKLAQLCVVVMVFMTAYDVSARYFFNKPTRWALEYAQYLLLAMTFVGMSDAYRAGRHIALDVVVARLPERVAGIIRFAGLCMVLGLATILTWQGIQLALRSFLEMRVSPGTETPLFFPQLAIPLGGMALCLAVLARILKALAGGKQDRADSGTIT